MSLLLFFKHLLKPIIYKGPMLHPHKDQAVWGQLLLFTQESLLSLFKGTFYRQEVRHLSSVARTEERRKWPETVRGGRNRSP